MLYKTKKNNSLILILYLYQYGLLSLFGILFDGQYAIMFFSFFLVAYSLLTNKPNPQKTVLLYIIPLCLLLMKLPFEYVVPDGDVAREMIVSFLTIGFSGIYIGSLQFSSKEFFNYGYKVGWINFLILFIVPFTSLYGEDMNYMKFGYSILPTVIFSFLFLFKKGYLKKSLLLFAISFIELLVFGARGAMLTFVLFAFFYIYTTPTVSKKVRSYATFISILIASSLLFILKYLFDFFAEYNLSSYALTKYLNLLGGDSLGSTSSGRDNIYESSMSRIINSPWFGSPINTCFVDNGVSYYHNIILDLLVNFGVLFFIFFVLFIVYHFRRAIKTKEQDLKNIFIILLILAMGRLLVSSSFWQRPEFWIFMSFCVCLDKKRHKEI